MTTHTTEPTTAPTNDRAPGRVLSDETRELYQRAQAVLLEEAERAAADGPLVTSAWG
jgi:hypothetical protein